MIIGETKRHVASRLAVAVLIGISLVAAVARHADAQAPTDIGAAPPPKLVWERNVDLLLSPPNPDERPDPLGTILAFGARADGGAVIVGFNPSSAAERRPHIVAIDGAGKDAFARDLSDPPGSEKTGATTLWATISADGRGPVWLFQTWRPGTDPARDDAAARSRLVGFDAAGREIAGAQLPAKVPVVRDFEPRRHARVMRHLPDGSLLAGGTAWPGPPIWWFARFSVSGQLLYEQVSRRFPDYIDDVAGNADGGFSLLMSDAEHGTETVTLRRHDINGRLVARYPMPELRHAIHCALLSGPTEHMRVVNNGADAEPTRSELVWHQAGRGIVKRIDLGARGCQGMTRSGNTVVLDLHGLPTIDDAPGTFLALVDGAVRWAKPMDAIVMAAPVAGGGALVLRVVEENGRQVLKLTRYAAP
jgi:hypothetical protein